MLPLEHEGVVDPKLRVYGTQNIRVADLSIVPLHIASHTQSEIYPFRANASQLTHDSGTAYGIGEMAAEIIRGESI